MLSNDSYQYVSAARNLLDGAIGATSIIYWDEARLAGAVPAPLTTFPIGYPTLLGALAASGLMNIETAGLLISLLAMIACLAAIEALACRMRLRSIGIGVMTMFATSAVSVRFGGALLTEPLFTALELIACCLLLRSVADAEADARRARGAWRWALAAGVCLGVAWWVRYAGLFFALALAPWAVMLLFAGRGRALRMIGVAGGAAGALIAAGFARNIAWVGDWRGGNARVFDHRLSEVLRDYAMVLKDTVFGAPPLGEWPMLKAALAAGVLALAAGVLVTGLAALTRRPPRRGASASAMTPSNDAAGALSRAEPAGRHPADQARDATILLAGTLAVYLLALLSAALRTDIDRTPRMLLPILPHALLLAGAGVAMAGRRLSGRARAAWLALAASVLLSWVAAQWLALRVPERPSPDQHVRAQLEQMVTAGPDGQRHSLLALTQAQAGERGAVMANEPQASAYVLDRPLIALTGPERTALRWDEATVREQIERYRVRALLLHRPPPAGIAAPLPTGFLRALADGHAPAWLEPVARTTGAILYRPRF